MTPVADVPLYQVERILCPTEYSPACARILHIATSLAEHLDAQVRVLHVWRTDTEGVEVVSVVPGHRDPLPGSHPPVPLIEDMRTLINHVPPSLRHRLSGIVAPGGIRHTILQQAHDAQLIVMGTRGLTGLSHVLLGSVAESIVARAPCPVMTTRPDPHPAFPRARIETLPDGLEVLIRPIVAEDRDLLRRGVEQLSPESRYRRFMAPIRTLTDAQLDVLTNLDYRDHMAWGAVAAEAPNDVPIGSSRYRRIEGEPEVAEAAIAVVDAYQRRGIGTLLLKALMRSAASNGIKSFRGYVLKDNTPVQCMLEDANATLVAEEGECLQFDVALPESVEEPEGDSPLERVFRAIARRMTAGPRDGEAGGDGLKTVLEAYARLFR